MTLRAREILSWYGADNVGTLTLARLLNHGRLAGTGKLVILRTGAARNDRVRFGGKALRRDRHPRLAAVIGAAAAIVAAVEGWH